MKYCLLFTLILVLGCTSPASRDIASLPDGIDARTILNQIQAFGHATCPRFPFGIEYPNQNKWSLCCIQHNIAYWKGGSSDDRAEADKQLRSCIIEQNEPNAAGLVYLGVRHMDTERSSLSHHWGYGWVLNRGYTPLSSEDKAQISEHEKNIPKDWKLIPIKALSPVSFKMKDSLTANICVDAVLTFIQHHLHRTLTPMRVEHHQEKDGDGFEETVKINDQLFPEPYEFKFYLTRKNACTTSPSQWSTGTRVWIKSFSY